MKRKRECAIRPLDTLTREAKQITGLWDFRFDPEGRGIDEKWFASELTGAVKMAAGASYNDIFTDQRLHDYSGPVWYQKQVRIPSGWRGMRQVLHFESITHGAMVWLNDSLLTVHQGGYTPFEGELARDFAGETVRITVRVDNTLTFQTIPPGMVRYTASGRRQAYWHDFFNYAGIHRPVWLYATPKRYLEDITLRTDIVQTDGYIDYTLTARDDSAPAFVEVRDAAGTLVAQGEGMRGRLRIPDAVLWAPGKPYLYTVHCYLGSAGAPVDHYPLRCGIRTVRVEGTRLLINGEPFYFQGFGMHEDIAVIGKGHNDANMLHDFELLNWIGANSFRTSHYPYSEDVLDYADEQGIVVIDETAAVGLYLVTNGLFPGEDLPDTFCPEGINDETQAAHLQAIRELIARDKNHPCVAVWSIANEPGSQLEGADNYFEPLFQAAREADPTRPVGFVNQCHATPETCKVSRFGDILMLNRYFGWYTQVADLPEVEAVLRDELERWSRFGKPIVITEYGADAMAGLHGTGGQMWTEEYQRDFLELYHRVFDDAGAVVGEQVWNFADFATEQGTMRVGGNRKGVFTRDRTPKAAAFLLKERWNKKRGKKDG